MKLWRNIVYIPRELNKLPIAIKRISFVIFLYYLSWGLLEPFLPIYFKDILGTYTNATLVIALLYLFSIFWSLPMGDLADKVSKKKLLRLFLIFYIPLGPIISVLSAVWHFVVFRLWHSFLATGLWSVSESYVRAHSPSGKTSESIGIFDFSWALSLIIGSLLGGILASLYGIRILFFIMPIFVLLALAFSRIIPDHCGTRSLSKGIKIMWASHFLKREFRDFWKIPQLVYVTFLCFVLQLVAVSGSVLLPLFSNKLGANPIQISIIFALFYAPTLFEAPFSVLADHFNQKKILLLGSLGVIITLLVLFFASNIMWLFGLSFCWAVFLALIYPVLAGKATALMPREKIGELNGVHRSFIILASVIGIFVIGPIADNFGINYPFLLSALIMIAFFFMILLSWSKMLGTTKPTS